MCWRVQKRDSDAGNAEGRMVGNRRLYLGDRVGIAGASAPALTGFRECLQW